jgi:hypothetical protein
MTLQSSGAINMSQINSEFGRGTSLGPYRGTTWYTDSGSSGTFSSGSIAMSSFYSKRATSPTFYVNVSGPDVNLYWYCIARGWNGSSAVVATTVGNVYGSSTGSWAMIIDAMPSSVILINNNYIAGHGGRGGHGGDYTGYSGGENGEGGGPALYVSASNHGVTIYNYGVIGGGGGGGGGAALYEHGYSCCGQYTTDYYGGDGGGGGAPYGTGGRGGSTAGTYTGYIGELSSGDPGTDADFTNHGNGGSYRTYGGNGGGIGQSGTNGGAGGGYGIGYGAGSGWAVYGTNRVTWASYGTVLGPVGNT